MKDNYKIDINNEDIEAYFDNMALIFHIWELTNKILEDFYRANPDKKIFKKESELDVDFFDTFDIDYLKTKSKNNMIEIIRVPIYDIAAYLGFVIEKESNRRGSQNNPINGCLFKNIIFIDKILGDEFTIAKLIGTYYFKNIVGEIKGFSYLSHFNEYYSLIFAFMLLMPPKRFIDFEIAYIKKSLAFGNNSISKSEMVNEVADYFLECDFTIWEYQRILERMLQVSKNPDFLSDNLLKAELEKVYNYEEIKYLCNYDASCERNSMLLRRLQNESR